jgi:hypothetical protein
MSVAVFAALNARVIIALWIVNDAAGISHGLILNAVLSCQVLRLKDWKSMKNKEANFSTMIWTKDLNTIQKYYLLNHDIPLPSYAGCTDHKE